MDNNNYILVDVFEPEIIKQHIQKLGIPIKIENLEAADYVIGEILVERKEILDFFSSISQGRLFNQLYKMKQSGMKGFLVIIGPVPTIDYHNKCPITKEKYMYYLRTLEIIRITSYCSYNIALVHLNNNNEFIRFIEQLWKYTGKAPSYPPSIKKETDITRIKANILNCFPAIGMKTAVELAKRFKLIDLFNMPVDKLKDIEVNGKRLLSKAVKIKEILNS